jgi:NAD(P)-dependent dehydrogenase (short-subunit alcohol dehydrogenase family)
VVIGASSGFGHGATLKLASYGSNVVLAARRIRVLKEVAVETRAAGGTPLVGTMDISKSDKLERLEVGRFGCIDVWINNADIGAIGWFEDVPLRDYDRVIDVNLRSGLRQSHGDASIPSAGLRHDHQRLLRGAEVPPACYIAAARPARSCCDDLNLLNIMSEWCAPTAAF